MKLGSVDILKPLTLKRNMMGRMTHIDEAPESEPLSIVISRREVKYIFKKHTWYKVTCEF